MKSWFTPLLVLTFLLLGKISLFSQSQSTPPLTPGVITVHCPHAVDSVEKHLRGKNELRGYRIQVFLGNMTEAKSIRQKAMTMGLNQTAYIVQNTPDYAVRLGDFKSLIDAQLFLLEAKKTYPGAFIIPDKIEPPRLPRLPEP
ncbi:MAG: SPOR domain-containing protein [Flavobacteriales bacterium]|jgi:hypothetical protein